jgi:hypothetical protein
MAVASWDDVILDLELPPSTRGGAASSNSESGFLMACHMTVTRSPGQREKELNSGCGGIWCGCASVGMAVRGDSVGVAANGGTGVSVAGFAC